MARHRCGNILQSDKGRTIIHLIIWIIRIVLRRLRQMWRFPTHKSNFSTTITLRVGEFLLKGFSAEPFEF